MKHWFGKRKNEFIAAAIAMTMAVLFFSLNNRMIGGEYNILYSDLHGIYIPVIKSFYNALLGKESVAYSFSMGLGMPSLATYSSLSPFNIIYLLVSDINVATAILVTTKIGLMAFLFAKMVKVIWKQEGIIQIASAVLYALCSYVVVYYYNIKLLDGVYMLPLVVLEIYRLIRDNSWKRLSLSYAYLFIACYYEGYIVGFFTFFLFIFWLMFNTPQLLKKEKMNRIWNFIRATVIAAMIAAFILLPAAYYMLSHVASDRTQLQEYRLNIIEFLLKFYFGQWDGIDADTPYVYVGILPLLSLVLYFCSRYIDKKEKIVLGCMWSFLIICCFWKQGYLFMHCFDAPDGCGFRFSYLISFLVCVSFYRYFAFVEKERKHYVVFLLLIPLFVGLIQGINDIVIIVINVVLVSLYFLLLQNVHKKNVLLLIMVVLCGEIIMNSSFVNNQFPVVLENNNWYIEKYNKKMNQLLESIEPKEKSNYRISTNGNINDPMSYGFMGDSFFGTTENSKVRNILNKLGYSSSARLLENLGSTSIVKMLLGEKYTICVDYDQLISEETNSVPFTLELNNSLELAYMVDSSLLDFEFPGNNAFENINALAQSMCGEEVAPFVICEENIETEMINANFANVVIDEDISQQDGSVIKAGCHLVVQRESHGENALINWYLPIAEIGQGYAYNEISESKNIANAAIISSNPDDLFLRDASCYLSRLTQLKKVDDSYVLSLYFDGNVPDTVILDCMSFAYEDLTANDAIYDNLKQGNAKNLSRNGTDIEFDVNASDDKRLLFTSIPYDEGWHIIVDGHEEEIIKLIDDTFMGVELSAGNHHIKMYYDPLINKIGIYVSIAGLLLLVIPTIVENRKKR